MKNICDAIDYDIIQWVTEHKGVSLDEVLSGNRKQNLFFSRMLISYCLLYCGWGLDNIGKKVGRDHSTVHYYKTIFLGGVDVLTNYEVDMFTIFLAERGVELPGLEDFSKRMDLIHNK